MEQFSAEAQVVRQESLRQPGDAVRDCHGLQVVLEKFHEARMTYKPSPPGLNPKHVWLAFEGAGHDLGKLNRLEMRTLCSSEETALRPELIAAMDANRECWASDRCIHGFTTQYFSNWRTMPNAAAVEALLLSVFSEYRGKNPAIHGWLRTGSLFSERASSMLANDVCIKQAAVNDVLKGHYIEPITALARATRDAAAASACELLRKEERGQGEEWQLKYLRWITENILRDVSQESLSEAIGSLILSVSATQSAAFQHALLGYVQDRLGDPRERGAAKWRLIDSKAKGLYLSWLAKAYFNLFFETILPKNSVNEERKLFWFDYLGKVIDFNVAVSAEDEWKLKASSTLQKLIYSKADHATTSAFLMVFNGYKQRLLIAEFSEKGNAAYVLSMSDFGARQCDIRQVTFNIKEHLKFDKTDRILHLPGWQPGARARLAESFGIVP